MTAHDRTRAALQARALAGSMREDVRGEMPDTSVDVTVDAWRKLADLLDELAEAVEGGDA